MRSAPLPLCDLKCCSDGDNMEAQAVALEFELVAVVTSGGRRQWQQWEGRSHGMRHYNNKGNLVMLDC